jgi:hypothetical protein
MCRKKDKTPHESHSTYNAQVSPCQWSLLTLIFVCDFFLWVCVGYNYFKQYPIFSIWQWVEKSMLSDACLQTHEQIYLSLQMDPQVFA